MTIVAEDRHYPVPAQDRAECIDLINRLNLAFDEWDIETMVAAFTPDATVTHPKGDVRGHDQLRAFCEAYYPLTLGVRRQAVNHVVDGLPNGLVRVTSYHQLIRVAAPAEDRTVKDQILTVHSESLPALSIHSLMFDDCRRDEGHGWRICARRVERTVVNRLLR